MSLRTQYIENEIKMNQIKQMLLKCENMIEINDSSATVNHHTGDALNAHKAKLLTLFNEILRKQIDIQMS